MFRKRKASIKFVGRKQSIYGLISTIIAGVCMIALGMLFVFATKSEGTLNIWMGLIGLLILVLSLIGLLLGTAGFKQKDIFYRFPIIGVIFNGILFVGMVVLYFLGLSMMVG